SGWWRRRRGRAVGNSEEKDITRRLLLRRILPSDKNSIGRRDAGASTLQALLQRRQELQHHAGPCVVSHQTDAPRLALEIAKAAADLDAELGQQALANCHVIHA